MKKYLVLAGSVLILTYCSVEKNTDATRFYNSMTARYNIYFNGYENFKAGLDNLYNNYSEDFGELLNVFEYSNPSTVSYCSSDMERAITKASKLISLKSITAKPEFKNSRELSEKDKRLLEQKEYNQWVDDSYLLIGKARFYKHEFIVASSIFDYCIANANDPDIKTEAAIWQARVSNETNKYPETLWVLTGIEMTSVDVKALKSMYYATLADLYVKQKKYNEAIDPLLKAIENFKSRRTKYRLTYLLGQLHEILGNESMAISCFQNVIKMRPPYDLEFYARIKIAGVFDVNAMDPGKMKRELEKMLRDAKNVDFHDQIYYALGNLAMKEGKESEALEYYHKSASAISQNQNQKGRSYLALANYYFRIPDFISAGMYFDSTAYFMDPTNPEYPEIQNKSQNLNALVSQLVIIQREDSLQKVAKMTEGERNAIISKLIAQATIEETSRKQTDYTDRYNLGQYYENERRAQGSIEQEGKWYFYNQSALAFGRTEFRRRWGDRKLEDNWRRINKTRVNIMQASGSDEPALEGIDTSLAVNDYKKPEFYLKDLPLNDSLLALSDEKISTAMMNAGKAFSERLLDQERATETYEALIERYPGNELVPEALFYLYRINKDSNPAKSEVYRQRLLQEFPQSEYSRILSDPDYYEKKLEEARMAIQTYNEAYRAYEAERFSEAMSICNDGMARYPQDQLAPKFQLLNAYCTARISDERNFRAELSKVIKNWPNTTESRRAEEIIVYLDNKMPELKAEEEKVIAQELYKADTLTTHIFSLVIIDPSFNINQATFDVISYNIDNYTNNNFKTEGSIIENKFIMINVSGFRKYSMAMDYYRQFNTGKIVRNPSGKKMLTFIINDENLNILKKDVNPDRYYLFFQQNYLK